MRITQHGYNPSKKTILSLESLIMPGLKFKIFEIEIEKILSRNIQKCEVKFEKY